MCGRKYKNIILNNTMKPFSIIVACTEQTSGIGCKGKLPWKLNGDMNFFTSITTNTHSPGKSNAVIMGRKTYQSIPSKFRPLPSRVNIVLSSNSCIREELGLPTDVLVASSLKNALDMLETEKYQNYIENVFVIGGASVYSEAIRMPNCVSIYLTQIKKEFLGMDLITSLH